MTNQFPTLILECANAHGGKLHVLLETIEKFSALNYPVKHIKFQPFHPDGIALPDFEWYPVYRELLFADEEWSKIITAASERFDGVWLDIFDLYGLEVFSQNNERVIGIKLQASVLENAEVLLALRNLDVRDHMLMLNVSGYAISEIERFFDCFRELSFNEIILQLGHQAYPTRLYDTGLKKARILGAAFPGLRLCLADHVPAEDDFATIIPLLGVAVGCSLIEKHICLDRSQAKYDYHSSLDLAQTESLAARLQCCPAILDGPFMSRSEKEYLEKSVQIPVAREKLSNGSLVSSGDVVFRRTAQPGVTLERIEELQKGRHVLACDFDVGRAFSSQDFKRARIGVIVACRMKSDRLKGKALLPIAGSPSVERCLENCLMLPEADIVVLATSTLEEDRILEGHLLGGKVAFWRGHPDDVIRRYIGACDAYDIDVIIRVTADCPVISPEIAGHLLAKHFETGADYTSAKDCAVGTACEIYNAEALRRVLGYLGSADHSEYMTWYLQNNPDIFKVSIIDLPPDLVRQFRLTLDYAEDLQLFELLYEELERRHLPPTLKHIFAILDTRPDLVAINSHLALRYKTDQELIDKLDRLTRIRSD